MKKLLSFLGVCLLGVSSSSVTVACSASHIKKELVKNKLNNLVGISSSLLRGAMVQNASQDIYGYNSQVYDANFLHDLVISKNAYNEIENIDVNKHEKISILKRDYFNNQKLYRKEINDLNKNAQTNKNEKEKEKNFLSDNVKSPVPNKNIESAINIISIILNGIKTEGGINPPIAGLIQGLLPKLPMDEDMAKNFSSEKLKSTSDGLKGIGKVTAEFFERFNASNIVNVTFSLFLNTDFLNAVNSKDNMKIWGFVLEGMKQINFDEFAGIVKLVNPILKMDKKENMTNKQVMNATVRRIGKVISALTNIKLNDNDDLYKDINFKFETDLGIMLLELSKKINKLDFSKLVRLLPDLAFIISGILHRITIFDFSKVVPISNKNLFDAKKDNAVIIKELGQIKFEDSLFDIDKLFKNLLLAFGKENNNNGWQLARLIGVLFESGSSTKIDFTGSGSLLNILGLLGKINGLGGDYQGQEGLSPIFTSLGWVIYSFIEESIPKPLRAAITQYTMGNALKAVTDMLVDGRSMINFDAYVNTILKMIGNPTIKFDDETKKIMTNSWNTIWKKESGFLKTLIGKQIALETLLYSKIFAEKTLYDFIKLLYENIKNALKPKQYNSIQNDNNNLEISFNELGDALVKDEFTLFKKDSEGKDIEYDPLKAKDKKYNALQTFLITAKNKDVFIKIDGKGNKDWKGNKAAIIALGADFDNTGTLNREKFRDKSILSAVKKIYNDKVIQEFIDQIIKGINVIEDNKNNLIKNEYEKLIDKNNFKSKVISHKGLLSDYGEAEIIYQTEFKYPNTDKTFKYQIELKLTNDDDLNNLNWRIWSIKKIQKNAL